MIRRGLVRRGRCQYGPRTVFRFLTSLFQRSASGVRSAARNLGWMLASRGVLAVLSLIYLGIATRALGIKDFGRFALITGAAQAIAIFAAFQTWQIVVRYGVDHLENRDEGALGRLFRLSALVDLGSAVVGIGMAAAILSIWGESFSIGPDLMRDTMIFAAAQLISIRSTPIGILRLRDQFAKAAAADSITPAVRFIGAVVAAFFLPTVEGFLWGWAAAEVCTAAAYWWFLHRSGDLRRIFDARVNWAEARRENPNIVRFSLSANANATLGMSTKQIPILFVGGFVGTTAAGAFRLALQLAQALAKLSQLIARAAFPEVVKAVRTAPPKRLSRLLSRVFAATSAGALVILALIALVGKPLLVGVGGDEAFVRAYPLLLWLAAAGSIDLAVVAFEPVLLAGNRAVTALVARVIAVSVQIGVMIALLPVLGAAGASMGVFAGSLVGAVLLGAAVIHLARRSGA
nr:lipopolysaccharide biosynthesis protein [Pacificimonas flava]